MSDDMDELQEIIDYAKRMGATEAKIIDSGDIVIDKRVRLKCSIPQCYNYGRHLLCPPNLMSVEEFEEIVRLYEKALIVQVETDYDSSDKSKHPLSEELCEELENRTETPDWELKLHRLVNQIEAFAFKRGFYLAAGLIGGECCLCEECIPPSSGESCRHPFESRPSMEAMGIDVYRTCENVDLSLAFSSEKKVKWTGLVLLK